MTAPSPRSAAPAEALVERFREALARLLPEGGKLGLAVSGGPDSLAMLLLAEAAIPGQFEVATVDHGLRPQAADECAMVVRVCAERGIPCEVLKVAVPPGNVQAKARDVRYEALGDWAGDRDLSAIATAHHADDQAETLLMRLNRGSGLSGLAGVRERGLASGAVHLVPAIRPLLRFRRSELAEVVSGSGLNAVEDPSNQDDRFERTRIRKAIADNDWLDPLALTDSAAHLAEVDEQLQIFTAHTWLEDVALAEGEVRYRRDWHRHPPVDFAIVRLAIRALGKEPRGQDAARLVAQLRRRKSGNVAGVLATVEGDDWVFRREPPRRTG
jgi:tRNA(Ile)-lysidine synthase